MRLKWILFSAVFFPGIGLFLLQLFGPNSSVRVSPQTTAITSPLAADGLPNYAQALVDQQRAGMTRENNGAREFWQAMGPVESSSQYFDLLCRELGVTPVDPPVYLKEPTEKSVRTRVSQWLASQAAPGTTMVLRDGWSAGPVSAPAADGSDDSQVYDLAAEAQRSPWTASDYPPLAEWANENAGPLDLLVSAASKPRFFSPPPNFLMNPEAPLIEMLLPHAQAQRSAARALMTRAMLRAGDRQYAEAWQDCRACWQLGAHAASGTLVEGLVGMAIRGVAKECTLGLLQCEDLPEAVAEQILDDLNALPPEISVVDMLDRAERYMYLDSALRVITGRFGGMSLDELSGDQGSGPSFTPAILSYNGEVPLEMGNQWYDRLVQAARVGDFQQRREALAKFDEDLNALTRGIKGRMVGGIFSRQARSEVVGQILLSLFLPALDGALKAQDRDRANLKLARIAAALAVFKARHGAYPAALGELAPDILPSVPLDPYDGKNPLHYERRGEGYLLYSVFENGADDGGSSDIYGLIVQGEWLPADDSTVIDREKSDLVIRMPRPVRKLQAVKAANADGNAVEGAETDDDAPAPSEEKE